MIVSGYTPTTLYTSYPSVQSGDLIHLPLYNTSYIVALPLANATYTSINFHAFIQREIPIWEENMRLRKIITSAITVGGVCIFLVTFGVICLVRKIKGMKTTQRGKVQVEPARGSIINKEHQVMIENGDGNEGSQIDFEDLQENRTLESPMEEEGKTVKGGHIDEEIVKPGPAHE